MQFTVSWHISLNPGAEEWVMFGGRKNSWCVHEVDSSIATKRWTWRSCHWNWEDLSPQLWSVGGCKHSPYSWHSNSVDCGQNV